jgi:hypothetical protein
MKKMLLVLILLLLAATPAMAAQMGGMIAMDKPFSFSLSAAVGYHARQVYLDNDDSTKLDAEQKQFLFKPNLSVHEHIALYLQVGFTDLTIDNFRGRLGATYGGGLNLSLLPKRRYDKFNVGIDIAMLMFDSEDDITYNVLEYSGGLYFTYDTRQMSYYLALQYSDARYECDEPGVPDLLADDHFGVVMGIDYLITPEVFFIGEMHNFDEDFILLGVGYWFKP